MLLCCKSVQRPNDCKNISFGLHALFSQFAIWFRFWRARFSAACKWSRLAFTASFLFSSLEAETAPLSLLLPLPVEVLVAPATACTGFAGTSCPVVACAAFTRGFLFGATDRVGLAISSLLFSFNVVSVLTAKYLRINSFSVGRSTTKFGLNGKRVAQMSGTTASLTTSLIKLPFGCSCCFVNGMQNCSMSSSRRNTKYWLSALISCRISSISSRRFFLVSNSWKMHIVINPRQL